VQIHCVTNDWLSDQVSYYHIDQVSCYHMFKWMNENLFLSSSTLCILFLVLQKGSKIPKLETSKISIKTPIFCSIFQLKFEWKWKLDGANKDGRWCFCQWWHRGELLLPPSQNPAPVANSREEQKDDRFLKFSFIFLFFPQNESWQKQKCCLDSHFCYSFQLLVGSIGFKTK